VIEEVIAAAVRSEPCQSEFDSYFVPLSTRWFLDALLSCHTETAASQPPTEQCGSLFLPQPTLDAVAGANGRKYFFASATRRAQATGMSDRGPPADSSLPGAGAQHEWLEPCSVLSAAAAAGCHVARLDRVEHNVRWARANSVSRWPMWTPVVANPIVSEFQPPGGRARKRPEACRQQPVLRSG